jgi:hypothetical protein
LTHGLVIGGDFWVPGKEMSGSPPTVMGRGLAYRILPFLVILGASGGDARVYMLVEMDVGAGILRPAVPLWIRPFCC